MKTHLKFVKFPLSFPSMALLAVLLIVPAPPLRAKELPPIEIQAIQEVDEILFILRFIERNLDGWTSAQLDSDITANWALNQRLVTKRLRENSKEKSLPPEIIDALNESLGVFEAYDDYLIKIGAASADKLARANMEQERLFKSGAKAFQDRARSGAYDGDEAGKQVVKDAIVVGVVGGLIELWNKSERDEAEGQRAVAAETAFRTVASSARLSIARIALRLSAQRGWKAGEAGFDSLGRKDEVARRPRDPFAHLRNAAIRVENEKAANLLADARQCVFAARLVPSGGVYDQFRAEMLVEASNLAVSASTAEWFETNFTYGGPISKEAVSICRTSLLYDPDLSDLGKLHLALALNKAGHQIEALEQASAAKGQMGTGSFAFIYAVLLSQNGMTEKALESFERALKLGYADILWSKVSPGLARMREAHPVEFKALTDMNLTANIVWGVLNDDYQITNNSKFAITNLRVKPVFVLKDERTHKVLTAARIAPGETYTWENAFSIHRPDFVELEFGEWDCDQKNK